MGARGHFHPHEVKGFIYGIFASLMYASMATFVKFSSEISNETLIFFRNLICLIMILPGLLHTKTSLTTTKVPMHLCRAVFGLAAIYAYFYSIKHLPLANAVLLATTIPLFTPLVVFIWLRVKVPVRRVVAVFIGFAGVAIVLKPGDFTLELASVAGLLAGLSGAIALVSVRLLAKTEPTQRILFYFFLSCVILSFFPMMYNFEPVDSYSWLLILGVGVTAVLFQYFLTKAFSYAPATKVSSLLYLNVVFGGIFSWMFFDQVPSIRLLIGALFIIIGGLLSLVERKGPLDMA